MSPAVPRFVAVLVAVLLAGLPLVLAPWPPVAVAGGALAAPDQIHLSIVGDPARSMAVTWRTASGSEPHRVQWETTTGDHSSGQVSAASQPAPGNRGFLHKAEMISLNPNTEYRYRVSGDGEAWSDYFVFRTAPDELPPGGFVFTVNADLGTSSLYTDVGYVMNEVAAEQAALHLIAGDITYANRDGGGTEAEEYFFATDLPVLASKRPVMVAWGNHEYIPYFDVGIWTITSYFQLPRTGLAACNNPYANYSFRYAGVHFVALDDPDNGCFDYAAQQRWLRSDLARAAADPTVRWKVVFLHQPPLSSGSHRSQERNRYPEIDEFKVNLVLAGHNHEYERTWPTDFQGGRVEYSYSAPSFATYLIAGVGGAPTSTGRSPPNAWSAHRDDGRNVGYVRLTVTPNSLRGEFVGKPAGRRADFKVVDDFKLTR